MWRRRYTGGISVGTILATFVASAAVVGVTTVSSAATVIDPHTQPSDLFEFNQASTSSPNNFTNKNSSIEGVQRKVTLDAHQGRRFAEITSGPTGLNFYGASGSMGSIELTYPGISDLDLTDGGTSDHLQLNFLNVQGEARVRFTLETDGTSDTTAWQTVSGSNTPDQAKVSFSDFASGIDPQNIDGAGYEVESIEPSSDLLMGDFAAVPSPSAFTGGLVLILTCGFWRCRRPSAR